jgi:hypothetical protein
VENTDDNPDENKDDNPDDKFSILFIYWKLYLLYKKVNSISFG